MNAIRYIIFILTFVISAPSFGLSVGCNDAKVIDEVVSHQYFQLGKTNTGSSGLHFEVEFASELEDSSLKDIVLYKTVDDEVEYFFNLKFILVGKKEAYATSGFTLSHNMIEGAELVAVFEDNTELCTTVVRKYRTKR